MISAIIAYSIRNRLLILLVTSIVTALGVWGASRIRLDAIPDLSDVQVIVYADYPGQAPQVVEDQVTYPLATAMLAVPKSKVVRGLSVFCASFDPWPRLNAAADTSWSRRNRPFTRVGDHRRKIHRTAHIVTNPSASPSIGETTMKIATLRRPDTMTADGPATTIAAPTKPPMSACEEEVGRPSHQVRRFHVTAPISAASTTSGVASSGWMMPLAMVLATCTPNMAKAMKLKNDAQMTAIRGDKARVLTTVAIELAASWNPLLKSKNSATRTMAAISSEKGMAQRVFSTIASIVLATSSHLSAAFSRRP